jgi:gamma-glutamyl-gamma-aminobutyrate hydrolase PuuD
MLGRSLFRRVFSHSPAPVIAIASLWSRDREIVDRAYAKSIFSAGGIPLIVPITSNASLIDSVFSRVDGALVPGGPDIDPALYGELPVPALGRIDRAVDDFHLNFIGAAVKAKLPLFGICRGYQLTNVYFGGTLHQDIPTTYYRGEMGVRIRHGSSKKAGEKHEVTVMAGTNLRALLGCSEMFTNSIHHQAVKKVGEGLRVTAVAPDGLIEGIERIDDPRVYGVQWHPEIPAAAGESQFLPLFRYLVDEAAKVCNRRG